ncbi:hypothetical protein [Urbifossiella limnaea]|uniref:LTXXQ motif protein n=1 Tax=Urbifossiella limnaea TaxID=2528023 RepID=A0A517XXL2_9BACT|nr:hypothetical protein [Urbifossiella limnaea]QDU22215.1 hypothetical protein ETAA1_41920 [Urbifossiella limnaea]
MRTMRWPLVAFLTGAMVVMVSAQQPGGRQGGGKGGLTAQVLTNAALQEELKVTEDQKAKLKAHSEKSLASMKDRFKDAGGDKEKFGTIFAEIQAETAKVVNETLTAAQKTRLKQVERQVAGVRAFSNDELTADLKLEDAQKTKIKGILEEYAKDSKELGFGGFGKGGFDKEKAAEAAKKREKLEKGALADITDVLNDSQRKAWMDLSGTPVADIAKLRAGQFGGFGGAGGAFGKGKQQKKID